jgi:hypothetical protein
MQHIGFTLQDYSTLYDIRQLYTTLYNIIQHYRLGIKNLSRANHTISLITSSTTD